MERNNKQGKLGVRNALLLVQVAVSIFMLNACDQHTPATVNSSLEKGKSLLRKADTIYQIDEQQRLTVRALDIAKEIQHDSLKYTATLQLGYYALLTQNDSALLLIQEGRDGFERIGVKEKVLRADAMLLNYYTRISDYDNAYYRICAAERIAGALRQPSEDQIYYYLQKARFYHAIGFSDSSLRMVNRAEMLGSRIQNDRYSPQLKITRAVIYAAFGNHRKSVDKYLSVLPDFKENTKDKAIVYTNIGNRYCALKMADSATVYFDKALKNYTNMKMDLSVINHFYVSAAYSLSLVDRDLSLEYFNRVDPLQLSLPDQLYYKYTDASLAVENAIKVSKLEQALDFATENAIPLKDLEKDIHDDLYNQYKILGNTEKASFHLKQYNALNDAVRGEKARLKIQQVELVENIRKKEEKIHDQELLLTANQVLLEKHQTEKIILVLLAVVVSGVLFWLWRNHRKRTRISEGLLLETKDENERMIKEVSPMVDQVGQAAELLKYMKEHVLASDKAPNEVTKAKDMTQEWLVNYREQSVLFEAQKNTERDFLKKLNAFDQLSETEKEIVVLIRQGLQTKEISDRLNLALNTVEIYRSKIRKKLNVVPPMQLKDFIKAM